MTSARWNSFIQFLCEVYQLPGDLRQSIVDELLSTHTEWPWVERDRATFVYDSLTAHKVSVNIDIVNRDPPFENLVQLDDTSLWYYQRYFDRDALVDYMFAIDDPGTPLAQEVNLMDRVDRFWEADPLNALTVQTAHGQYVRFANAAGASRPQLAGNDGGSARTYLSSSLQFDAFGVQRP